MTRFSSDSSRNGKDHRVNPTSSFGEHGGGGEINKKAVLLDRFLKVVYKAQGQKNWK